jgi:lysophospholipase L1-like esterase
MRLGRRLLFSLVVLLVLFGGAEVGARSQTIPDPMKPTRGRPEEIMLHGNAWLLWDLQPGRRVEQGRPVTVNDAGFRDAVRGPRQGPRAMALGDSSVYGFGVADDETFSARIEAATGAEVVNAGIPGYSSFQATNLLDMRGWALEPDLLFVATLWSDNNFDSFVDKDLLAAYAGWGATGASRVRRLLEYSQLFRWLDWKLRVEPQSAHAHKVGWTVGGNDTRSGLRRVSINDYAVNLEGFCERMLTRGGGVVFVMLPNREDITPLSQNPAWNPYRQVMRETGERYGATVVDLPAAFKAAGRSADALFLDQMHPTALGHQLAADAIVAALGPEGWPHREVTLHAATAPRPTYTDSFEGRGTNRGPTPGRR